MKMAYEDAIDVIYGDLGKIVEDTIVEHSEWTVTHRVVFEFEGKFYVGHYRVGVTEYQYGTPHQEPFDDVDEVEFHEVIPVKRTITAYERKVLT